ncbi:MAG TPA: PadR family transcriptional regulator [Gemmatimonadaceae bacterium]|nr:PadR family transcriptional regulator [Gemmatimonadaceae bacterium]
MPESRDLDLLQGTLDLMILRALSWGQMHGFGIAKYLHKTTDGVLEVDDGALYPALHRMDHRGLISSAWGVTANGRRAKYYQLTPHGRRQLRTRVAAWDRYVDALTKVIHATMQPA